MKKYVPLIVVGALLLSGCTPSQTAEPAATPVESGAVQGPPSSAPSSSDPIDRFAAVISQNQKTWRSYEASTDACTKAGDGRTPDSVIKFMNCIKNAQTVAMTAQKASAALLALGAPPAEIQTLVTRTVGALGVVRDSNATTTCQNATSDACYRSLDAIDRGLSGLEDVLVGWEPYTSG